jgi:DNA-binding LacI/PurR family transcriptional regulator
VPPGKPEKYKLVARGIEKLIINQNLREGDKLPPERRLAEQFEVTQLTVRRALAELVESDLIHKEPSRGNFVGASPRQSSGLGLVAFLVPEHEIYFYSVFAALEKELAAIGLHPVVHITGSSAAKEQALLEYFEKSGFDAVIAVPNIACADIYQRLKIPVIFFDNWIKELEIPSVISDDFGGAFSLTEYLISMGHRRIAHIGGGDDLTAKQRLAGWRKAMEKHKIEVDESLIMLNSYSRDWGYYAAREMPKDNPPTVLFCANDTLAAGAIRYLHEKNIQCSVTGFGDTEIAGDLDLTSVSQSCDLIAGNICRIMSRLLRSEKQLRNENIIAASPVIRGSVRRITH